MKTELADRRQAAVASEKEVDDMRVSLSQVEQANEVKSESSIIPDYLPPSNKNE